MPTGMRPGLADRLLSSVWRTAIVLVMRRQRWPAPLLLVAMVLLAVGAARSPAQAVAAERVERVAAVLREHDPMHDGAGADALLLPDSSLDAAIGELARSGTSRPVQQRALRLWRAIGLAERVRTDPQQRSLEFWLAFAEIDGGMAEPVRASLLARAFADAQAAALRSKLAAGTAAAKVFCSDWNENRPIGGGEAERATRERYDELEAALREAGAAAAPFLLEVLAVSPWDVFAERDGLDARSQVRALFAFAHLESKAAMPCYVMQAAGPSLTMTSNAAAVAQKFAGEDFGAGLLQQGNDESLLAWWRQHRAEHEVVLDHLVHHVVRIGRVAMTASGQRGENACWATPRMLGRLLGNVAIPGKNASRNVLEACVQLAEDEWLLSRAGGKLLAK